MSFSFDITGARDEVVGQIMDLAFMDDPMGEDLTEAIAFFIARAGEPEPGMVYRAKGEGHSSRNSKDSGTIELKIDVGITPLDDTTS